MNRHARLSTLWDLDPEEASGERLYAKDMRMGPAGEVVSETTFKRHKRRGLVPPGRLELNGITYSREDHATYWVRLAVHRERVHATRARNVKEKVGPRGAALQKQREHLRALVDRCPLGTGAVVEQAIRDAVLRSGETLRLPRRRHPHSLQ